MMEVLLQDRFLLIRFMSITANFFWNELCGDVKEGSAARAESGSGTCSRCLPVATAALVLLQPCLSELSSARLMELQPKPEAV